MYFDLLFYCLLTALVSVGFFWASEKGNILYFIKRPVVELIEILEKDKCEELAQINYDEMVSKMEQGKKEEYFKTRREIVNSSYNEKINFYTNIFKPIYLCPRCMASIWSGILYFPLTVNEYGWEISAITLIPAILITVTLNSIFYKLTDL